MDIQQKMKIIIDAENKTSKAFADAEKQVNSFSSRIENLQPTFKKMAAVGGAALTGLTALLYKGVQGVMENEYWYTRMANVLRNTAGASDEAIKSMRDLASENTLFAAISEEASMAMIEEAASFGWTTDQIAKFLPTMNNFVGLMNGVGPTAEAAQATITGLGKASSGYAEILSKKGFILDDTQKEILELGDAEKSLALLTELLGENYADLALELRDTTEGQLYLLRETIEGIGDTIAAKFMPHINDMIVKITEIASKVIVWMEKNPKLAETLVKVAFAIAGLLTVVGLIGMALPPIIAGFTMLGTAFTVLMGPVGLIILAFAALVAAGIAIYKNWEEISLFLSGIWETIKNALQTYINFMVGIVATFLDWLFPNWQENLQKMLTVLKSVGNALVGAFKFIWDAMKSLFDAAAGAIKSRMESLIAPIQKVINLAERALSLAGNVVKGAASKVGDAISSVVQRGAEITGLRASGGPVSSGQPYMVGENGPETFVPNSAGRIMKNGSGGTTIVLQMSGNTFMGREGIADMISQDIVDKLQLRMKLS